MGGTHGLLTRVLKEVGRKQEGLLLILLPRLRRSAVCVSVVTPNESNTSQPEVFARNPSTKVATVTRVFTWRIISRQPNRYIPSILPLMEVGVPISAKLSSYACGEQICKEGRKETETKKREDEGRDQNSITALVFRRARSGGILNKGRL